MTAFPRGDYPPTPNTSLALELDKLDVEGLVVMFSHELVRAADEPYGPDWRDEIGAIARKRAPAANPPIRYLAPNGWVGRDFEHTTFVCGACPNPAGCRLSDACRRATDAQIPGYTGGRGGGRPAHAPEGDPEFLPVTR